MDLQSQASVMVDETLDEFKIKPDALEYERLAEATVANLATFDGSPELARAVAAEFRRRALVIRNQSPAGRVDDI